MNKKNIITIMAVNVLLIIIAKFDKNLLSLAAIPVTTELGLTKAQLGMAISCFYIGYVPMNIIGGYLADKFGSRPIIIATTLLWSVFTGLTAFTWSLPSLVTVLLLFGLAEGAFPPTNTRIVGELFPVEKRGLAKSTITASSKLGIGLGALATTQFMLFFEWRTVYLIYCAFGFVLCMVFLRASRGMEAPKPAERKNTKFTDSFHIPHFWKLILINFAFGSLLIGLNAWLPSYWMQVRGLKLAVMGFAAAIPTVFAAIVMIYTGYLLDRFLKGKERGLIVVSAICGAIGCYGTYVAPSVPLAVAFSTLAFTGAGIMQSTCLIIVVKYFPMSTVGSATGMCNAANQVAGIILPASFGLLLTAFNNDYASVFGVIIAIFALVSVIAATINVEAISRKVKSETAGSDAESVGTVKHINT